MKLTILSVSFFIMSFLSARSQTNDDCLMCHSEPDMTMEKGRNTISIWVNNSKFIMSVHKKLKCVSCHKGFNPDDIPHKANIQPVDCKSCHTDLENKHVFHPWMKNAPLKDNCKQCHGTHFISSPKGLNSGVGGLSSVEKCGNCHKDVKAEFLKSEHYKAIEKKHTPYSPDCNYCHRNQITNGWGLDYKTKKQNQINVCKECHNIGSKNPDVLKRIVSDDSRHAKLRKSGKQHAAVCTDCHGFHNIMKNDDFDARLNPKNSSTACGKCHVHIAQEYQNSIHGLAQTGGNTEAAGCVSCHFEHSKDKSQKIPDEVYKKNLLNKEFSENSKMDNCISCHTKDSLLISSNLRTLKDAHKWLPSLGKHFASVTCYECHSSYTEPYLSHNILPLEKSLKSCNNCHSKTHELKSILYNYDKNTTVEKEGMIRGGIEGNTNYVGLAKNIILDYLSMILLGGIILGLLIHAYIRWYFKKGKVK